MYCYGLSKSLYKPNTCCGYMWSTDPEFIDAQNVYTFKLKVEHLSKVSGEEQHHMFLALIHCRHCYLLVYITKSQTARLKLKYKISSLSAFISVLLNLQSKWPSVLTEYSKLSKLSNSKSFVMNIHENVFPFILHEELHKSSLRTMRHSKIAGVTHKVEHKFMRLAVS